MPSGVAAISWITPGIFRAVSTLPLPRRTGVTVLAPVQIKAVCELARPPDTDGGLPAGLNAPAAADAMAEITAMAAIDPTAASILRRLRSLAPARTESGTRRGVGGRSATARSNIARSDVSSIPYLPWVAVAVVLGRQGG